MELYIHERPWQQTEEIAKRKLQARNRSFTDTDVKIEMRESVSKGLVDPLAIDELICESNSGTSPEYINRIKTEYNKWFVGKKQGEIFNPVIQKTLDDYLTSLVENKKSGNKTFSVIFDRFNAPSAFTNANTNAIKLINTDAVVVNMYDLLYNFYYQPTNTFFNMHAQHEEIKKYIQEFGLNNLNDCKKFEGNTFAAKDYLNPKPKQLNSAQKALERNYLTKKNILAVGKYMTYKLLELCFSKNLDIIYFEHDYNPYHINCILTKHFTQELASYQTNLYFIVMDYNNYIKEMISMFKNHGNYLYTGVLEKYEAILQNMLVYASLYFRNLPNTNIKILTFDNNPLLINSYSRLAEFVKKEIITNDEMQKEKDIQTKNFLFEYKWDLSANENLKNYKEKIAINDGDDEDLKEYKKKMHNHVESYIQQIKTQNSKLLGLNLPPVLRFAYGAPGVGKSTYLKNKCQNYASISRDDAVFRGSYYDDIKKNEIHVNELMQNLIGYDKLLVDNIKNKIKYKTQSLIWRDYWQYALVAFDMAFLWAVKNKLSIVTDIGGTADDPFAQILSMLSPEYKIEVYAFHAKFSEHYMNQLIRSIEENRLINKKDLKWNTEKVYENLFKLLNDKNRKNIDIYIVDNTYYNYKILFTRINDVYKSYCDGIDDIIDKDEIEFKKVRDFICSKTGAGDKTKNIFLIVIIVLLLFLIFSHDIFNYIKIGWRKIIGMGNKSVNLWG